MVMNGNYLKNVVSIKYMLNNPLIMMIIHPHNK